MNIKLDIESELFIDRKSSKINVLYKKYSGTSLLNNQCVRK